jgi:hypothetical protein
MASWTKLLARHNRSSEHDLLEDFRLNGNVRDMRDVAVAVFERNGQISPFDGNMSNAIGARRVSYSCQPERRYMPIKSQAQRRKFAQLLVEGKIRIKPSKTGTAKQQV